MTTTLEAIRKYRFAECLTGLRGLARAVTSGPSPFRIVSLSFVRGQVAHAYGRRGNKSVPPKVILRMMLLLFLEDIKSERELMRIIPKRLDYFVARTHSAAGRC